MAQLKALLSALIVFLPLVVSAGGPQPFSLYLSVSSSYRDQALREPFVHVTVRHYKVPHVHLFEGFTDSDGRLCSGIYADCGSAFYIYVSRGTPDGVLDRCLPLLRSNVVVVKPRHTLYCYADYDWDTGIHHLECRSPG